MYMKVISSNNMSFSFRNRVLPLPLLPSADDNVMIYRVEHRLCFILTHLGKKSYPENNL